MPVRILISSGLILGYLLYVKMTFSHEADDCNIEEPLYLQKYFKLPSNLFWITVQLLIGLAFIIYGAHLFVKYVDVVSTAIGLAPFILSLIITPIATELPEKLNSVIWIGKKKDALALGNITGAMVFQSCFPVSVGILFTSWQVQGLGMITAILAFASAIFVLLWIQIKKSLHPLVLTLCGLFYLFFLYTAFYHKGA
jgi:cation:H+ antiporter